MDYDIEVRRYWLNLLLCWHGQRHRRILKSNNGVVAYCVKCNLKHTGIYDFGTEAYR